MIQKLFSLGDDALQNLFDMSISPIPFIGDMQSTLLRVQGFTIPATGSGTYEVNYKTQKITKPSGKIEAPNEFSVDIRIDKYWAIYKGLVMWKNAVANSYTGAIAEDSPLSNNRVPISVWAVDANSVPTLGAWVFDGCYPSSIGDVAFDYSGGEPLTLSVTFQFLALNDNLL